MALLVEEGSGLMPCDIFVGIKKAEKAEKALLP